jgi:uncharacterized repeat protein (TIGR02543 family)
MIMNGFFSFCCVQYISNQVKLMNPKQIVKKIVVTFNLIAAIFVAILTSDAIDFTNASTPTLQGTSVLHLDTNNQISYSGVGTVWADLTSPQYNATLVGPTFDEGIVKSFDFDGIDDYVAIPHDSALKPNNITIEMWVNLDNWEQSSIQSIVSSYEDGGYYVGTENQALQFSIKTGGQENTISTSGIGLKGWQLLTLTYNGSTQSIYINGVLRDSSEQASGNIEYTHNNSVILGAAADTGTTPEIGQRLNGKLSQVRIYATALSAAEVLNNYQATSQLFAEYSIQTNQQSGSFTGGSENTLIAPNLQLRSLSASGLDKVRISITDATRESGDTLTIPSMTNVSCTTSGQPTGSWLCTNATPTDVENFQTQLRKISFSTSSTDDSNRIIVYTIGQAIPDNGRFYIVENTSRTWTNARDFAARSYYYGVQGYLATITSAEENALVTGKLGETGWIAYSDEITEGRFVWLSGPERASRLVTPYPFTYTNWNGGEPNNSGNEDYTQLYIGGSSNGRWNDLPSTSSLKSVIEYGWGNGDTDNLVSNVTLTYSADVVYSITYNEDGGVLDSPTTSYLASSGTITLPVATKLGYNFDGWYSSSDFSGSPIVSFESSDEANKTFYAKWSLIDYSITYNGLFDGTNNPSNPAIYNVNSGTITLASPTRSSYSFAGWFENSDLSTSGISQITEGFTGNKVLYAKWSPINYSITYDYNVSPNSPTNPQFYREFIIPASKIDANLSNFPVTIILDDTNYDFTGITYSGIYFTDANNTLLDFEVDAVSTTPNKVVYHVRVPAISSTQDTAIRAFYSTQNDYSNGNNPGDVWDDNYIFVSHMGDGISNVASATPVTQVNSITYSSGLLGDVANFNGGFIELPSSLNTDNFTKIILATPSQIGGDHNIITAANDSVFWINVDKLNATYKGNFKPSTVLNSPLVQTDSVSVFAKRFSDDDSHIWYNTSTFSITEGSNLRDSSRAPLVIGAYNTTGLNPFRGTMDEVRISNIGRSDAWIKAEYYSLTDNLLVYSGVNPSTYDITSGTITLTSPQSLHRTFDGWFENSDLITPGITQISMGSLGNKTLYASWTDVSYSITYDANGGSVVSPITNYSISSGTVTLPSATKAGYQFDGWFENPDLVTSGINQLPTGSFGNRVTIC